MAKLIKNQIKNVPEVVERKTVQERVVVQKSNDLKQLSSLLRQILKERKDIITKEDINIDLDLSPIIQHNNEIVRIVSEISNSIGRSINVEQVDLRPLIQELRKSMEPVSYEFDIVRDGRRQIEKIYARPEKK